MMIQLSRVNVDPSKLEEYKRILKEEIETSLRIEEDVYVLYAVSDDERPNEFTIIEHFKDQEAYDNHCKTPHMQKYFAETEGMVQYFRTVDATPVVEGLWMKK